MPALFFRDKRCKEIKDLDTKQIPNKHAELSFCREFTKGRLITFFPFCTPIKKQALIIKMKKPLLSAVRH